jgi:hypothetical protein
MRYGIRTELTGVSQEQYDALHEQFKAITDDTDRIVVHVSGPTAGGWYVFEVWESKADYERFMQKALPLLPPVSMVGRKSTPVARCKSSPVASRKSTPLSSECVALPSAG